MTRRRDGKFLEQVVGRCRKHIDHTEITPIAYRFCQKSFVIMHKRCVRIITPNRLEMFATPLGIVDDFEITDCGVPPLPTGRDRNGEQDGTGPASYLVTIGETVALKLHMIEHDMHVAGCNTVKIAKPRKVGWLADRDHHRRYLCSR